MQKLVEGYRRFHSHIFPQKRKLYASLANGQSPKYLFMTCCDSRVNPTEFTGANAGDLFVERSLGNIVPRPGGSENEATSSIEYAVLALNVEHIIVCGHSQCGAMKALLDPELLATMPTVAAWLSSAGRTYQNVMRKHPGLEGEELLKATIRENVLVQVDHVKLQPCVAPRVADGTLQVHGWVFEFEQGQVLVHDLETDEFIPLTQAYSKPRSRRKPASA